VFTHREPTEEWKRMFISEVKRKYNNAEICIRRAEDLNADGIALLLGASFGTSIEVSLDES
jgi:hypothetical protein